MRQIRSYLKQNVHNAALQRLRWIYDEFPNVVCCVSGGKDSTVLFYLTLMVAKEKGRLPLRTMWIDQEVEWQATADTIRAMMERPDVEPYWLQVPMRMTNNVSSTNQYIEIWHEGCKDRWMRDKHPLSIKDNRYGADRFKGMFSAVPRIEWPVKTAMLSGVRAEESPKRLMAMTAGLTYKDVTWAKKLHKDPLQISFYPLYDWGWRDIWKAIHDNDWPYNPLYDAMYCDGAKIQDMRISSLHHEHSKKDLQYVQKMEPDTWAKLIRRVPGAHSLTSIEKAFYTPPDEPPAMFEGWKDYTLYLADKLITYPKYKNYIRDHISRWDHVYNHRRIRRDWFKTLIKVILTHDFDGSFMQGFSAAPGVATYRNWIYANSEGKNRVGKPVAIDKTELSMILSCVYIPDDAKEKIKSEYQRPSRQ